MAGLAMSGNLFSPWGVEDALKDCKVLHGKTVLSICWKARIGEARRGMPRPVTRNLPIGPDATPIPHVQAYYRWIQRAWLSGLRLVVTDVTENRTFCQLLSIMHPFRRTGIAAVMTRSATRPIIFMPCRIILMRRKEAQEKAGFAS